jgi:hypothetical protein
MFEWNSIQSTTFKTPKGDSIQVKLFYELKDTDSNLFVDGQGMDIDAVAHKFLGTEAESLNILQNNKTAIVENDFDMSRVKRLKIPT